MSETFQIDRKLQVQLYTKSDFNCKDRRQYTKGQDKTNTNNLILQVKSKQDETTQSRNVLDL